MSGGRHSQCSEEHCETTAMTNKSGNDVSDDDDDCDDVRDDGENESD